MDRMTTNRTPINRRPTGRLTPQAIEIFKRMVAIKCTCGEGNDCDCPGCREHLQLDDDLSRELGLRPWQFPSVVYADEIEVTGPGTVGRIWCGEPGRQLFGELAQAAGVENPPNSGPWGRREI
jgi:hypothetical protein